MLFRTSFRIPCSRFKVLRNFPLVSDSVSGFTFRFILSFCVCLANHSRSLIQLPTKLSNSSPSTVFRHLERSVHFRRRVGPVSMVIEYHQKMYAISILIVQTLQTRGLLCVKESKHLFWYPFGYPFTDSLELE